MILAGILASQITGHLVTNSYESIQTVSVSSATSSISFTSIPATYKHLQVRMFVNSSGNDAALVNFNSDSGANYTRHRLTGNGSAAGSAASTGNTAALVNSGTMGFPTTTNYFGISIMDILDYTDTNKYTTMRSLSGEDINSNGGVELTSNLWLNTAAITRIDIAAYGGNWTTGSHFALYGIKG